ncbi:hypothetical protein C3B79_2892 [Aeromonas hydrophila]|nr:hypothetical protein C3B79_2892 [Aeromonas hydrophila]
MVFHHTETKTHARQVSTLHQLNAISTGSGCWRVNFNGKLLL